MFIALIIGAWFQLNQVDRIVLNFAGDCTLAGHFETFVGDRMDYPFDKMKWFGEADVSMVNLENPITMRGQKVPKEFNFRMHPAFCQVLLNGGVDVVTLANNHVMDYGDQGVFDTVHYLDSVGIKHVGAGANLNEARKSVIISVKGKKIGFLAYFGGGLYAATAKRAGTAPRKENLIVEDVRKLRNEVDFVVVNFHWSEEMRNFPNEEQQRLAHRTIDAGADLIIGHHPHVLQGIEKYRHGIIAHSLGNFIFGGNSRREYDTIVLQITIQAEQVIPTVIPIHVHEWQPYRLEGFEADRVIGQVKEYSHIFEHTIF
jgi:poly-gamma-glutamate synthesis protein (capsule biosynthesis protein)